MVRWTINCFFIRRCGKISRHDIFAVMAGYWKVFFSFQIRWSRNNRRKQPHTRRKHNRALRKKSILQICSGLQCHQGLQSFSPNGLVYRLYKYKCEFLFGLKNKDFQKDCNWYHSHRSAGRLRRSVLCHRHLYTRICGHFADTGRCRPAFRMALGFQDHHSHFLKGNRD